MITFIFPCSLDINVAVIDLDFEYEVDNDLDGLMQSVMYLVEIGLGLSQVVNLDRTPTLSNCKLTTPVDLS